MALMEQIGGMRGAPANWRRLLPADREMALHLLTRVGLVLAAISFAIVLTAGIPVLLGYDSFVVTGGSMAPAIREGSLLISKRTNPADIHPGDVITFRRANRPNTAVTHRVVGVSHSKDGTPVFRTKGDANPTADPEQLSAALPISRMVFTVPYAGYVLEFASTLPGKIVLILLPAIGLFVLALDAARNAVDARALARVDERRRRGATRRLAREADGAPATPAGRLRRTGEGGPSPLAVALRGTRARIARIAAWRPRFGSGEARSRGVSRDARSRGAQHVSRAMRAPVAAPPAPARPRPVESTFGGAGEGSAWVERVAADLTRQMAMLEQIRDHVLNETGPVARLLDAHDELVDLLHENADRKLAPLIEYADNLEADIEDLKARLGEENADDVTAPLRPYFEEQRRRVVETRTQVERLRRPLEEYVRAQRESIESIFVPFEGEVRAVEEGQSDQVRILKRMLTGLRSDQFETAVEFIEQRITELRALADAGASDPASMAAAVQVPVARSADLKRESLYLGPVLEGLTAADARAAAARAQERVVTELPRDEDTVARVEPNVA